MLPPSRIGCQLLFSSCGANSLLKGLYFACRNGEDDSTAKPMYYPNCRVVYLGKYFQSQCSDTMALLPSVSQAEVLHCCKCELAPRCDGCGQEDRGDVGKRKC